MSDFIKKKEDKKAGPIARGTTPKKEEPKVPKPKIIIIKDGQHYDLQNMAKGGRAGFKSGSKGCKLAKRGRGRAYGKNS
mgnify:CR=1 FL=1